MSVDAASAPEQSGARLLLAAAVGALVALSLGLYGNLHDPASDLSITLGFKDTITMKVWLATPAALLAVVQVGTAAWVYGKLPLRAPPDWIASFHRISGRLAFLLTLPVAYHCLYQLAFQDSTTRVLVHSILGCAFYGAFAAKIVIVRSPSCPASPSRSPAACCSPCSSASGSRAACGSSTKMDSPRPDPLRRVDRVFAPLTWLIAAFAVVALFAGPELIGAAKPAGGAEAESAAPAGATVFASAGCGGCHTLAAADATGSIGPNLDELRPDAAAVAAVVTDGEGSMPAFAGRLSAAEIEAVSDYVASSAGG